MTEASTPAVLRHGPLTAEMVPLLRAGSSVLRRTDGTIWFLTHQPNAAHFGRLMPVTGENVAEAEKLTICSYIGERDADGWITAPEGGWTENPVPGMRVEIRWSDGQTEITASDAEPWHWTGAGRIIAFRLSDQPVENSPIPALGGNEGPEGRSHPKPSEPTPVRGLEPVAWHLTHREEPEACEMAVRHREPITVDDRAAGWKAEPLYSASDVSALQGEVERLQRLLKQRDRLAESSRKFWVRAGEAALNGDTRELRNRIELAKAEPATVVLSDQAMEPQQ